MKPVLLDFAAPSLGRALWTAKPWQLAVLAAALAACVVAGIFLLQARGARSALPDTASSWVQATAAPKQDGLAPAQIAAVNKAVQQLNTPWSALRAALAAAAAPGTALLGVEPDAAHGKVKISAESRNSVEMFNYIARLKQQGLFQSVELRSHEVHAQDANQPLRFQLEAAWGQP